MVATFWYGAQTSAAAGAIVAFLTRYSGPKHFHQSTHLLGHSSLEVVCFLGVSAGQLLIISKGMETVRRFQDFAGPSRLADDAGPRRRPVGQGRRADGEFRFQGGWNIRAFAAAAVGAVFSSLLPVYGPAYYGAALGPYTWFIGVIVAGSLYFAVSGGRSRILPADGTDRSARFARSA
ncbi:hypothetical protein ACFQ0T_38170 [Kitasatospora gansuensis]